MSMSATDQKSYHHVYTPASTPSLWLSDSGQWSNQALSLQTSPGKHGWADTERQDGLAE
jgi:hypothetical protein